MVQRNRPPYARPPVWPAYLVAAVCFVLAIGTTLILRLARRKSYALVTALPCLFLVAVTFDADVLNIRMYMAKHNWVNAWLNAGVLVIAAVVIAENMRLWIKLLRTEEPTGLHPDASE